MGRNRLYAMVKQEAAPSGRLKYVWLLIFATLIAFFCVSEWLDSEPHKTVLVAREHLATAVVSEQEQHERFVQNIQEVKERVKTEVKSLDANGVASALNNELRIWRSNNGGAGLASSDAGVLPDRGRRVRPAISSEDIPGN